MENLRLVCLCIHMHVYMYKIYVYINIYKINIYERAQRSIKNLHVLAVQLNNSHWFIFPSSYSASSSSHGILDNFQTSGDFLHSNFSICLL